MAHADVVPAAGWAGEAEVMSDSDKRVAAALQEARLFEVRCHARYYLTRNGACSPAGAHTRTNAR